MMMEHLPRPWYLAAMAGLSIAELVRSEEEEPRRQGRRLARRCDRKRRRPSERRRRAPHFARH
jgi:hypothetical protein